MMRTLQGMVRLLPTRSKLRSCSTRNSFTCICSDMSPISSRNSVPPSANSKRPDARRQRAREGALLVAEQFALQQIRRNGAAIDGHEGMAGATRQLVDVARDHFLARAGFAEDQHIGIERGHLFDQPMHRAHGGRIAARAETVSARLRRMTVAHVLRLVQHRGQPSLLDRQFQMQPGQIAAALGDLRKTVARQIDHGQRLRHGAQLRHQFPAFGFDGFGADDQRQPIVRTVGFAAELGQIVEADRLKVQKSEQGLELRACESEGSITITFASTTTGTPSRS